MNTNHLKVETITAVSIIHYAYEAHSSNLLVKFQDFWILINCMNVWMYESKFRNFFVWMFTFFALANFQFFNQWQKLWDSHPLTPYSMLVANLPAHFWSWLPGMASSGLAQHWVREKGGFWVTLSKSNVFLWAFLWKYSEFHMFLSLIVTKLVNLGEEITLFKVVNRSFPVNIKGSIVHRSILLVFSFI